MPNIYDNPHDKLIDKFLEDTTMAASLLKNHLPAKALEKLDFSTLKATSETVVTEKWEKLHNNIVFRCMTKKKDTYMYLLIEHQSTPDPFMPLHLLRYKLNLLGKYIDSKDAPEKVPNILSLVIYHGEKEYPYEKDIFSCFEDPELAFKDIVEPMLVLDLTNTPQGGKGYTYYKQDVFSCFEDPELAFKDIVEPMLLLDLANTPEDVILRQGGKDAILKLLLKYSREKDFVQKVQAFMDSQRKIFLSLSLQQAKLMFEYVLHVGKGTPENAEAMKAAMNQIYGEAKAEKIFSLADFFKLDYFWVGVPLF